VIAVDLSNDVVIPQLVAIVGAVVAGISAVLQSWIENKGARSRGDRKLDLARRRTEFAKEWIELSDSLGERTDLREQADKNLEEAVKEAERAFYEASADTSTALVQLRRLLLLVRRRNPASYVVSGLFLFLSVFVWLLVCIPAPEDEDPSLLVAIAISIALTFALRVVAGVVVSALERIAREDAETITTAAVHENVVTLTTKGPHGFPLGAEREVVVDASDDRFDGTFLVTPISEQEFTFKPRHWAPDVDRLSMHGWVCGDTVGTQLRRLFLVQGGRRTALEWVASAVFLVSVVVVSVLLVSDARDDLDAAGYPFCYGQPYDGGYFGEVDDFETIEEAARFLNEDAPLWSASLALSTGAVPAGDGRLVADDGTEFVFDGYRLGYASGGTVLYERTGDNQLEPVDDPCEPQQRNVRRTTEPLDAAQLFNYFDDSAGYGTADELTALYESGRTGANQQVKVFFGPDGRLIPACDESYAEIQPCLEERNVYFDSGLDARINRIFQVGLMIFGFAIGLRLLIWLLGKLILRRQEAATAPGV
jgi:hypothetical protein